MTTYGRLLKNLINFSGSKLSSISERIGYDVSYISRWCNKDKLPSVKSVRTINRQLADYFAEEVLSSDNLDEFIATFAVQTTKATLSETIYSLLRNAYRTAGETPVQTQAAITEQLVLTSTKDILRFTRSTLPQMLMSYDEPLDIYSTMELCSFISDNKVYFLNNFRPKHLTKLHMPIDLDEMTSHHTDYIKTLYYFSNSLPDLMIDCYDHSSMKNMHMIIVKNHMALLFAMNSNNLPIAMTMLSGNSACDILMQITSAFRPSNILIKSRLSDEFYLKDYHSDFYAKSSYTLFIAKGFEYFLPDSAWAAITDIAKKEHPRMVPIINQIRITWEEIFEDCEIDFILLKSALQEYIENRLIYFSNIPYKMKPDEIHGQIQNFMAIIEKNPNVHIHVIDDEFATHYGFANTTSFYYNSKKLYLKNVGRDQANEGPLFYTVTSKQLHDKVSAYFEDIKTSPKCITFSKDDIYAFWDKYASMITRTIDLGYESNM